MEKQEFLHKITGHLATAEILKALERAYDEIDKSEESIIG